MFHEEENEKMSKVKICLYSLALVCLMIVMTGRAEAQTNTIYACKNNNSGEIKIAEASTTCSGGATKISWNQVGPAGPQGPAGTQGSSGLAGPQGPPGTPADLCAVYAALGKVPLLGSGLPCSPTVRFVNNNDGTITDNQTGLMWEMKTACGFQNLNDVHCVDNLYAWSSSASTKPGGPLFTDFLENLNRADGTSAGVSPDRKNYSDWRIPNVSELRSIVDCSNPKCLDPIFGPTQASDYWSSTTVNLLFNQSEAWAVFFADNVFNIFQDGKTLNHYARGVRGGR